MTSVDLNSRQLRDMQASIEQRMDDVIATVRARLTGHPIDVVREDLDARLAGAGVRLSAETLHEIAAQIAGTARG